MHTESELFFERYLSQNGYTAYAFEPSIAGQESKPDYRIEWQGVSTYHEIKELCEKGSRDSKGRWFNPYKSLRKLIGKARSKFGALASSPCTLVVMNVGDWTALLDPRTIFGAMLGDLGFKMRINTVTGAVEESSFTNAFLGGGKMIAPHTGDFQNQTISAIVVLKASRFLEPDFGRDLRRLLLDAKWKKGRHLSEREDIELRWNFYARYPRGRFTVPRVVVVENPVARKPLPATMFRGPYDERWTVGENGMACEYEGALLKEQRQIKRDMPIVTRDEPENDELSA
ncbi:MAG: hypothetical protein AMXMBFR7_45700 [Planctomycetota bacterium]